MGESMSDYKIKNGSGVYQYAFDFSNAEWIALFEEFVNNYSLNDFYVMYGLEGAEFYNSETISDTTRKYWPLLMAFNTNPSDLVDEEALKDYQANPKAWMDRSK